ncbi:MAG: NTP transferase domain-containing protein [Taibaiella sp.]|nr:NTP transferase domain-containing protein [Taibaiella sp.]
MRLRSAIGELPKCMAAINGLPFLHYLFNYLEGQRCSKVVLALGYRSDVIIEWLETQAHSFVVEYVIEEEALGTGGGIALAMELATDDEVAVLNGDTFFDVPLNDMHAYHLEHNADTTLALKEMHDFDRYGVVHTDEEGRVISFEEKKRQPHGFINGGVYIVNKKAFLDKAIPGRFSFERDYLEAFVSQGKFYGHVDSGYFIDIGIPADYERAQNDFKIIF